MAWRIVIFAVLWCLITPCGGRASVLVVGDNDAKNVFFGDGIDLSKPSDFNRNFHCVPLPQKRTIVNFTGHWELWYAADDYARNEANSSMFAAKASVGLSFIPFSAKLEQNAHTNAKSSLASSSAHFYYVYLSTDTARSDATDTQLDAVKKSTKDPNYAACGTHFVVGFDENAQITVEFDVSSLQQSEQLEVARSLTGSASGGFGPVSISADFTSEMKSLVDSHLSHHSAHILVTAHGGPAIQTAFNNTTNTNIDSLTTIGAVTTAVETAVHGALTQDPQHVGAPFALVIRPYVWSNPEDNPTTRGSEKIDRLQSLNAQAIALARILAHIDDLKNTPPWNLLAGAGVNSPEMTKKENQVNTVLKEVSKEYAACQKIPLNAADWGTKFDSACKRDPLVALQLDKNRTFGLPRPPAIKGTWVNGSATRPWNAQTPLQILLDVPGSALGEESGQHYQLNNAYPRSLAVYTTSDVQKAQPRDTFATYEFFQGARYMTNNGWDVELPLNVPFECPVANPPHSSPTYLEGGGPGQGFKYRPEYHDCDKSASIRDMVERASMGGLTSNIDVAGTAEVSIDVLTGFGEVCTLKVADFTWQQGNHAEWTSVRSGQSATLNLYDSSPTCVGGSYANFIPALQPYTAF